MPQKKPNSFALSYHFLIAKEQENQDFTLEELAKAGNWSMSSVKTYLTKKWSPFFTREGNKFSVKGIIAYTEDQYVRLMSQNDSLSNDPRRPPLDLEVERLVVKAREAALHALDGYNRPATIFRTESLTVMMVIAWRSLFHAIFEKRGTSYFYTHDDSSIVTIDGEAKAWDLSKCVSVYFGASNNPIRKNLEFIIGLRNRVEHRYVPAMDPHVAGECQALVLNFDNLLVQEFGEYYALRETLAVPLQTSTLRSVAQVDAMKKFQGKQYDDLKDYIDTFRDSLTDVVYQDPRFSFRVYLIPKIGNRQSSSDLAFEFITYDAENPEDMAAYKKQVALIKERQVPVANAGVFKPSQVAQIVSDKIGRLFKLHQHTLAWKMYQARKSGENPEGCNIKFCQFDQVHRDYVYTQEWVDFLVSKLSDEQEYQRLIAYKES